MKTMIRALLFALVTALVATAAFALDCTVQPVIKKNRHVSTTVLDAKDKYCAEVDIRKGWYRVRIEGRKAQTFGSNYSYEDVLQYACDYCKKRPRD